MAKHVDYYLATISPWMYLGHDRFVEMARRHGATIAVKPMSLGEVFPVSGGLPLSKRAPQRQAYRLVELKRWSEFLDVRLNLHPKFFPANGDLAACWVLAAAEEGTDKALALVGAIGRALWAEDRDIADAGTLDALAVGLGLDAGKLAARAPAMMERYAALTQEAIARGVFGAPTYVCQDELFWGQDRLDFLARKLAK
ncbi:MAG: 2-hydroxychromene-2-carboxylate isomerase [Burkholderiales bacterium]|nr:2-hydroxychromene-2-carboxylate isomerase [Burkholderiales bacterium]